MPISFPAPALVQGSDQEVLIEMADVIFPGLVDRGDENGLRVWVEGDPGDPESKRLAARDISDVARSVAGLAVVRGCTSGGDAWRGRPGVSAR